MNLRTKKIAGLVGLALLLTTVLAGAQVARYSVNGGATSCTTVPSIYRLGDPNTDTGLGVAVSSATGGPCLVVDGTTRVMAHTAGATVTGAFNATTSGLFPFINVGAAPFASVGQVRMSHASSITARNSTDAADIVGMSIGVVANQVIVGDNTAAFRNRTRMDLPGTLANGDWWIESDTGAVTGTRAYLKARLNGATVNVASSVAGSIALDGSNPTSVTVGTTTTSCTVSLDRTTAVSSGTAIVTTAAIAAGVLDIYAWVIAGTASTGTELVHYYCV